jgi:protein-disulfide isomerase
MIRPRALLVLRLAALVALGVSVALLLDTLRPLPAFCALGSGCDKIRRLGYGSVAGVPVALLGLLSFLGLFGLSLVPSARRLTAAGAIAGGVIGAGLLLFQVVKLGVLCKLCAIVDSMSLTAAVAGVFLWRDLGKPQDVSPLVWLGGVIAALGLPAAIAEIQPPPPVPPSVARLWVPDQVTIVEFSDFECPFCRLAHPHIEEALAAWKGKPVHFVRKTMPLPAHPHARDCSRGYVCAARQGKGDAMADRIFRNDDLSIESIESSAAALGLDMNAFRACRAAPETDQAIDADVAFVRAADFQGLPTVWIGDQKLLGARETAEYSAALAHAASGESASTGRFWPLAAVLIAAGGLLALGLQKRPEDETPAPAA